MLMANTPQGVIDVEKRVGQFIALRDKIADIEKRHEEELKPYKEAKAALSALLLNYLRTSKQESARTDVGTVSISNKVSATVEDPAAFRAFCIEQDWTLADLRANANRVELWIEEHEGQTPPGVRFSAYQTIGVRRS